ncbi:kinesin-like protein KIF18A [Megachile rotundata]|uniref:kinesin-like protein KIF18A n=1 Tax=Megachile rotundata TaxID=143995 RepID=UPI000258E0AA|nr:PREDICTED: kinesin-like protein KIF18A [Megachile rotundata]
MVFNKKDLAKAFSPNKVKKLTKKRFSSNATKPSTSGTTALSIQTEPGSQTSIKVIVRVRPENDRELQSNCRNIIKIVDDKMLIFDPKEEENPFFYHGVAQKGRDLLRKQNKELQFIFDKVFNISSNNSDVFEGSTKDLITSLLDGYNCSVFAYGATGAGKTHTMLGSSEDPGITYRTVAELFAQIEQQGEHREFNLGVTYLEIYNENVQDLLHKSGPLHLRDDGRCGVIVAGLKVITIHSAEELLTLLAKGNKNRTQHPTDANEESSRSHAVFQVYINITNKLDGQVRQVKLSMIDLAGSERASATGCKGARFKEGANINKSLLALGNCINNLADGAKHITYRDSKLTRLLKDSLGGNCQTVMIANIAPSSTSYEDTYNTLRYANRAKKIKTHIKKNILSCEMHVTAYIKMVEEQKKEINYLKQKLLVLENGSTPIVPELKDSKTDEETDKYVLTISNKLADLLQRKRALNEKVLSLESADKILCCRIQYKKAADERLQNLTAAVDATTPEEHNTSGKSRVNKSLHYFERQRDSLKIQMEAAWEELCLIEEELQKLNSDIKSKKFEKLENIITLQACEIEKSRLQQQYEHAKKVSNLQQCEMQSHYSMIKMMSTTLQNYYNMMRGYGTMTDSMKEEFKQLIKLLEGVRNIKWSDMETVNHEECFYSLTCLSIPHLMDPLNNKVPIYTLYPADDQNQTCTKDTLNTTFNATCTEKDNVCGTHDTTVTLKSDSNISFNDITKEKVEVNETVGSIEKEENNVNCTQPKAKKRVLLDKNNINIIKTPIKQARKISPKHKDSPSTIQAKEKENKQHVSKPHITMSAKSIAILNKLKADKLKRDNLNKENTDGSLKAVREKERRGLITTHPYQKPNSKQKFVPAPASSRMPWQ